MLSEQDKQALLRGEYGVTRDGNKCKYVGISHWQTYPYYFIYFNTSDEIINTEMLDEDFKCVKYANRDNDVVGLWKDPEPEANTVTFTLPRALKEPKDEMWVLTPEDYVRSMYNKNIPLDLFNKRIFFNSEEDAKAWFDAMQNSRK